MLRYLSGGFLKLSSDGLKPIAIASPPIPLMGGVMGGMTTPTNSQNSSSNNDTKRENPFLQFVANTRYISDIVGDNYLHVDKFTQNQVYTSDPNIFMLQILFRVINFLIFIPCTLT